MVTYEHVYQQLHLSVKIPPAGSYFIRKRRIASYVIRFWNVCFLYHTYIQPLKKVKCWNDKAYIVLKILQRFNKSAFFYLDRLNQIRIILYSITFFIMIKYWKLIEFHFQVRILLQMSIIMLVYPHRRGVIFIGHEIFKYRNFRTITCIINLKQPI